MPDLDDSNPPLQCRSNRPCSFVWRTAMASAGLILLAIGAFTIAAWATDNVEYVQFDPSLTPFHYNAAFGVMIWGAGYLALARGRHGAACVAATGMFAMSLVLSAAQLSETGFGLDRWLFAPPDTAPQYPHGGAPPTLIFGLIMAGIAIVLAARRNTTSLHTLFCTLIGFVMVIGGPTAMIAAQLGIATVRTPGLTLLGVIASSLAGLAMMTSVFRKGVPTFAIGHMLPLTIGSAGVASTFAIWVFLNIEQNRRLIALPKLELLIGLMTTALLALAVHLAQTARRRTADLEREVHERELTQQALRQSEEKYRSLIENLGQGIFLLDHELRYIAANATFCRNLGRAEGEVLGSRDTDLYDASRAEKRIDEARTVLAEGKTVEIEEDRDVNGRRKSIRRVLTPVRDISGKTTGVLGICWDVTEQRQLEAHVHQASKMDAIGQLAGGIAHDFNNLLTAILGNLDLMLDDFETSDSTRELAGAAHSAATRAASLTQRLLGFSRRHKLDWRSTNINAIADEVVALLRRTIDPLVRIETHLAPDLWPVQGDAAQINQVLMNLCLNARDAMPGGGRITIETTCLAAGDLPQHAMNNRAGDFIRLRVSDTGEGMTEEVMSRIYEPFFTTKEVGKGTGLGLPMVFAIVRQHKGWITCSSEVGRGTRFDIYLPRGEAARIEDTGPITPLPRRAGKETVLVVDDEEMIRRVASITLKVHGYSVLEAADGQQALDIYSREGDRINLVLLDLTMPILSGHETFRHLIQLNSRVKVLFASGYAEEQLSDLEKELMTGFLKKPYRPNDLIAAVEAALQRHGHGSGSSPKVTVLPELAAFL